MLRASTCKVLVVATASAFVAITSCALKPVEETAAARKSECVAADPLHWVSAAAAGKTDTDPEIESLLAQEPRDSRLMQINRRMYQSLQALDVELRREQAIAACKQPSLDSSILEAQTTTGSRTAPSSRGAAQSSLGMAGSSGAAGNAGVTGTAGTAVSRSGSRTQISALRKASVSAGGGTGGGNGATAPKIVPGSDNDIMARRLRKAAEEETDPALRAKLWKEYTDYRQGTAVAK